MRIIKIWGLLVAIVLSGCATSSKVQKTETATPEVVDAANDESQSASVTLENEGDGDKETTELLACQGKNCFNDNPLAQELTDEEKIKLEKAIESMLINSMPQKQNNSAKDANDSLKTLCANSKSNVDCLIDNFLKGNPRVQELTDEEKIKLEKALELALIQSILQKQNSSTNDANNSLKILSGDGKSIETAFTFEPNPNFVPLESKHVFSLFKKRPEIMTAKQKTQALLHKDGRHYDAVVYEIEIFSDKEGSKKIDETYYFDITDSWDLAYGWMEKD